MSTRTTTVFWCDGTKRNQRCEHAVHRPPYTQADRGVCARFARFEIVTQENGVQWIRYLCTQHGRAHSAAVRRFERAEALQRALAVEPRDD